MTGSGPNAKIFVLPFKAKIRTQTIFLHVTKPTTNANIPKATVCTGLANNLTVKSESVPLKGCTEVPLSTIISVGKSSPGTICVEMKGRKTCALYKLTSCTF